MSVGQTIILVSVYAYEDSNYLIVSNIPNLSQNKTKSFRFSLKKTNKLGKQNIILHSFTEVNGTTCTGDLYKNRVYLGVK